MSIFTPIAALTRESTLDCDGNWICPKLKRFLRTVQISRQFERSTPASRSPSAVRRRVPHRRHGCLRVRRFRLLHAPLPRATHVRQDAAAASRRKRRRLEHVRAVLSDHAAPRISLRTPHAPVARRTSSDAAANRRDDVARRASSTEPGQPGADREQQSHRVAPEHVDDASGASVLRAVDNGAGGAAVVCDAADALRVEPVFPLRREQHGQHAGAAGVSVPAGTALGNSSPDARVGGRLHRPAGAGDRGAPGLCGATVTMFRSSAARAPRRGRKGLDGRLSRSCLRA